MYQSVWKCRLCGQRFIGLTYKDEEVDILTFRAKDCVDALRTMHECYGDSKGIADLQGFERIRDKENTGDLRDL